MTDEAVAYLLASLASDIGNDELALDLLQELEPGQRSVRTTALAAVAAGRLEQYELADSLVAGLPEAAEMDEEGLAFLAHYWLDVAIDRGSSGAEWDNALNRSMELSGEAIRQDDNYLAAYYILGRAMAARGMLEEAEGALWAAFNRFPGELHVSSLLLRLLTVQERYDRALYMMDQVYSATHSAARRQQLQSLRSALQAGQRGEDVDLPEALCSAMGC
jgi:tetratricopeptide (TPR) repeat protein